MVVMLSSSATTRRLQSSQPSLPSALSSYSSLPWIVLCLGFLLSGKHPLRRLVHTNNHNKGFITDDDDESFVTNVVLPLYTCLVFCYIGVRLVRLWAFALQPPQRLRSQRGKGDANAETPNRSNIVPIQVKPKKFHAENTTAHEIDREPSTTFNKESDIADELLDEEYDDEIDFTAHGDIVIDSKLHADNSIAAPTLSSLSTSSVSDPSSSSSSTLFNLTGAYRLISNSNYEEYLAVQGVPWALRRAANQARPIHRITHHGTALTIKIEGIIESQTTYVINGPPVETNVRGRVFIDQVSYTDDGRGIQVCKTAVAEDYDVTVTRRLSEDGQGIILMGCAMFRDDRQPIEAIQIFQRIE